jgi:nickel-dependent lactate racemase
MSYTVSFTHHGIPGAQIPEGNLLSVVEPNKVVIDPRTPETLVTECLKRPIGTKPLTEQLSGKENVLILVDDYTRMTPADVILPIMIEEILSTGIKKEKIRLLVASGTHRVMTSSEKLKKYGSWVMENMQVFDHIWYDEAKLVNMGKTENGTEILVNSLVTDSDFIIGIGHIVPHRVAGFSGGAKILQPGVCGAVTTGQTHWLSAKYFLGKDIMGKVDNPVRREINTVGIGAGLKFIFNTVQAGDGRIYTCVCGDPISAFEAGCRAAKEVYGCKIDSLADIVIADAYPSHMNMWQASKGVYSADLALKDDGVLILVAPCQEGIAHEHPEVEELGYSRPELIQKLVDEGELTDLIVAAHILHVGRVISGNRKAILVSSGINKTDAERIGFIKAGSVQEALDVAFAMKGNSAAVTILKHGGEVLPILGSRLPDTPSLTC